MISYLKTNIPIWTNLVIAFVAFNTGKWWQYSISTRRKVEAAYIKGVKAADAKVDAIVQTYDPEYLDEMDRMQAYDDEDDDGSEVAEYSDDEEFEDDGSGVAETYLDLRRTTSIGSRSPVTPPPPPPPSGENSPIDIRKNLVSNIVKPPDPIFDFSAITSRMLNNTDE
jgi:hypothetical protein